MRTRAHAFGLIFVLTTLAVAGPSRADDKTPYPSCSNRTVTDKESELAHQRYLAGKAEYDDRKYDNASVMFRRAYESDCTKHELLLIIAATYEKMNDREGQIRALQTYLDRKSDLSPRERATHEAKVRELQATVKESPTTAPSAPPPAVTPPVSPSSPVEMREHTVIPWIVFGLGGATVVAGILVVAIAPELPDGCQKATLQCSPLPNETPQAFEDRRQRAGASEDQPRGGIITIGIGAVVAGGGLLWHFLEPTGPAPRQAAVRPQIAPGFAGMTVGGRF